jgi:transcriptional regulator NrdR family protein
MNCPICGLRTHVAETREDGYARVRRRRVCNNGHRFSTVEAVVGLRSRRQKYARNMRIKVAFKQLKNYSEVARRFKLSVNRVREIILGPKK